MCHSVIRNTFTHDTGLEGGSFFDVSAPHMNANMREYKGEPSDLIDQKIPPALVGNEIGKVARFRRVPGSTELPNGLAPTARSRPRNHDSVPPPSLNNNHTKLFSKCFFQIIPSGIQHTLLLGTNFTSLPQAPRFSHTLGTLGPKPHASSQHFLRAAESTLGVSFNAQSQAPDIPGISSLNQLSQYLGSFNTQSKTLDEFSVCSV